MKVLICIVLFVTFVASNELNSSPALDEVVNSNADNGQLENKKHDKRGIYNTGSYDGLGTSGFGGYSGAGYNNGFGNGYVQPLAATSRYNSGLGYNGYNTGYNTGYSGYNNGLGGGRLGSGYYSGATGGYPYNSGVGYATNNYNNGYYDNGYSAGGYTQGYNNYPYSRSGVVSYSHATPYVGAGYAQNGGYVY